MNHKIENRLYYDQIMSNVNEGSFINDGHQKLKFIDFLSLSNFVIDCHNV